MPETVETQRGSAETAIDRRPAAVARAEEFVELRDVYKSFGPKHVLRGVDLAIHSGEIFTLLGGSGTGKSVMLKHMIGLMRPDRGSVIVEGRNTDAFRERDWVETRQQIGFVFQGGALFDSLSVADNIAYALREHRRPTDGEVAARVAECLSAVGLSGIEHLMPAELSGGMRKRVAVARAIVLEPRAIFYDEPTTGLDPTNSKRIGQLIESLQARLGATSIVVTHELELCFAISNRIGLLAEGRMVACGTPDEIRSSERDDVQAFLSAGPSLEADSVWLTEPGSPAIPDTATIPDAAAPPDAAALAGKGTQDGA